MPAKAPRSVYVANLRRAFLLRAHPDRFRGQSPSIRRGQANLLQALSERMAAQDFLDYTTNTFRNSFTKPQTEGGSYKYVLEKRDGSLIQRNLQLDDSVENILTSIAKSLHACGAAASLPPEPPTPGSSNTIVKNAEQSQSHRDIHWASPRSQKSAIDHRFDVNSSRGRDLHQFLKSIRDDSMQIEERRPSRMDATTAALVARRLYSFQAIDGIRLGWSSASFTKLLRSFIHLHEEHASNFNVQSFYPLRLVFLPDEDLELETLDLYGGNIYLSPVLTPLQWLESLQEVTEGRLEELRQNRTLLESYRTTASNFLGVKLKKGHTCLSKDYHLFMERLSSAAEALAATKAEEEIPALASTSLALARVLVTVESPLSVRRGKITKHGSINVNSSMSPEEIVAIIDRLSSRARDLSRQAEDERQECKRAINQTQCELGVQKVYRTTELVTNDQFLKSLSRMLQNQLQLKGWLSGYSVGIAGTGNFCHLGDDGSVIIPHDWR